MMGQFGDILNKKIHHLEVISNTLDNAIGSLKKEQTISSNGVDGNTVSMLIEELLATKNQLDSITRELNALERNYRLSQIS